MQEQNKTEQKSNINKRYQSCGALWKKKRDDGSGYLSGRFTMPDEFGISKDYSISIWPNRNKVEGKNSPDFVIDYDTQGTKNSPARKKPPETNPPATSAATQSKEEESLGNPFEKERSDNLI